VEPLSVAYLAFTAVLVLTPGSTTAVIVQQTLLGGRAAGFAAALGAAVGNTTHASAAGLGLAVVFARWPGAMTALRVCGAVYLGWLGARSLCHLVRPPVRGIRDVPRVSEATHPPRNGADSFRRGVLVNLLNPAIAAFYLVVVPSFLPAAAPPRYFAALAAAHVVMALMCHGVWAVALDRVRRLLHAPGARRMLEAATGVALVVLALRVLLG
jgi:threonine/homoserine/homoserine lactone efflux protein